MLLDGVAGAAGVVAAGGAAAGATGTVIGAGGSAKADAILAYVAKLISIADVRLSSSGDSDLERLPSLRLRLSELLLLRREYEAHGKGHLLNYLEHLIVDAEAEISAIEASRRR